MHRRAEHREKGATDGGVRNTHSAPTILHSPDRCRLLLTTIATRSLARSPSVSLTFTVYTLFLGNCVSAPPPTPRGRWMEVSRRWRQGVGKRPCSTKYARQHAPWTGWCYYLGCSWHNVTVSVLADNAHVHQHTYTPIENEQKMVGNYIRENVFINYMCTSNRNLAVTRSRKSISTSENKRNW